MNGNGEERRVNVEHHTNAHKDVTTEAADEHRRPPSKKRGPGFVLWGPPGSGKTSLCEVLSHMHGFVHVSTGDLLRAHVRYKTESGVRAEQFMKTGRAVPDDVVVPLLINRLTMADCVERGYVLDGFPRSVSQDTALREAGLDYVCGFMLHAPRTVLERRIRGRRIDPETGILYNLRYKPPEEQEVVERLIPLGKDVGRNIAHLFALYGRVAADMFDQVASTAVRVDADRDMDLVLGDISNALRDLGYPAKDKKRSPRVTPSALVASKPLSPEQFASATEAINAIENEMARRNLLTSSKRLDNKPVESVENVENVENAESTDDAATGQELRRMFDMYMENANSSASDTSDGKSPITLIRCDGYMCERESVDGSHIAFRGAATEQVMLVWNTRPSTVLLLAKRDPDLMPSVVEAARYLIDEQKLRVIVEPQVQTEALANGLYLDAFTQPELLHEIVDFVVCLGGDGLILHVSTLFKTAVPPVLSFNLGSLGFLTPFDYKNFESEISHLMNGSCLLSLRMRLTCSILRDGETVKDFEVLNEVVVDRGASPYLSNLDCFCDDQYITTVQADGIIMSTPTGSTAYSMSAGGSMVHPSVPAILFTPICPHSLSFRPIVFPDAAKLRIDVAEGARSHAWASFDGKFRQQLHRGDGLVVQMSLYPVPTVNKTDHTGDWFQSLDRAFNFNGRAIQKQLPQTSPARRRLPSPLVDKSRRSQSPMSSVPLKSPSSSMSSMTSENELEESSDGDSVEAHHTAV